MRLRSVTENASKAVVSSSLRRVIYAVSVATLLPGLYSYSRVQHVSSVMGEAVPVASGVGILRGLTMAWVAILLSLSIVSTRTTRSVALVPTVSMMLFASLSLLGTQASDGLSATTIVKFAVFTLLVVFVSLNGSWHSVAIIAVVGGIVALFSVLLALVAPRHAFFAEQLGVFGISVKALIGSDQLAGPFAHSNGLGLAMATSFALSFKLIDRRIRLCVQGFLVLAVVWSASRTGILATVAVMLVYWTMRLAPDMYAVVIARCATLVVWCAVVVVPLATTAGDAFTRRGYIWIGSFEALREHRLLGLGAGWYGREGGHRNDLGAYASSGHNLFVHVLSTSGAVGAILLGIVVIAAHRTALRVLSDSGDPSAVLFLVAVAAISTLEYAFSTDVGSELFVFVTIPLLTLALGATRARIDQMSAQRGVSQHPSRERMPG